MAISSPLLDISMEGAKGVLFNITGGNDLTLLEINEAAEVIARAADPEANIIFGAVIDPTMQNEVKITVIATGFEEQKPVARSPLVDRVRQPLTRSLDRDRHEHHRDTGREPFSREAREEHDRANSAFDPSDDLDVPPFLRRRQQR